MKQSFLIGYKSLPLISITGFIIGLVLTIQSRPTLAKFGAESWLPAMVAVSIIREIGPVIAALIFAGKVGSGIGAELASMNSTEQIDAMQVSGTNPFKYLVVTRVLSATLMLPILAVFADAIGLLGSFVGVNLKGQYRYDSTGRIVHYGPEGEVLEYDSAFQIAGVRDKQAEQSRSISNTA